jgi:hypothetical protein
MMQVWTDYLDSLRARVELDVSHWAGEQAALTMTPFSMSSLTSAIVSSPGNEGIARDHLALPEALTDLYEYTVERRSNDGLDRRMQKRVVEPRVSRASRAP